MQTTLFHTDRNWEFETNKNKIVKNNTNTINTQSRRILFT